MQLLTTACASSTTFNKQLDSSPSVHYWKITAILTTIMSVLLILIYIATLLFFLRKIRKARCSVVQQHKAIEFATEEYIHSLSQPKRNRKLESMCANDSYMQPTDFYKELQMIDYNHVYATPSRDIDKGTCSGSASFNDCVQNPAYQIGSYQSESGISVK